VDGREIRGVIDAAGIEVETKDEEEWGTGNKEWAWEDVEELIFGQSAEDKTEEWKELEQKSKKAGKPTKGEDKRNDQNKEGEKEEEGSEETYYKDEL
jgi:hypothetical protein